MFFKNGELDVVGRAGLFRFLSPFSIFFLIPSSLFPPPPLQFLRNIPTTFPFFIIITLGNLAFPIFPQNTHHVIFYDNPPPPSDQRKNEKRRCSLRYDANLIFLEGGNTKTQIGKLSNRIIIIIIFYPYNSFPSFLSIWSKNFFATVAI